MLIENGCVIARVVARVFNIWKFTITTTKLFFTSIEMILALKNNNTTYPKYSSFDQGYIVNYWNANKSSITLTMIFTCHFVHDAFKMSDWREKSDTYTHIFSSSSNWNSIYCFHSQIVPKSKRTCNFGQVWFFSYQNLSYASLQPRWSEEQPEQNRIPLILYSWNFFH